MAEILRQVASFEDEASAEALAGMLRNQGVAVEVRTSSSLPGLIDQVRILVPGSLAHRARWFINSSGVSRFELDFAATGELNNEDQSST